MHIVKHLGEGWEKMTERVSPSVNVLDAHEYLEQTKGSRAFFIFHFFCSFPSCCVSISHEWIQAYETYSTGKQRRKSFHVDSRWCELFSTPVLPLEISYSFSSVCVFLPRHSFATNSRKKESCTLSKYNIYSTSKRCFCDWNNIGHRIGVKGSVRK